MTQGDWVGRYGMCYAALCGGEWPTSFTFSSTDHKERASGFNGPHHRKGDSMRQWQQWSDTSQIRCLYMPNLGHRRQTSWDDHGETYSTTYQGPDLWFRIRRPLPIDADVMTEFLRIRKNRCCPRSDKRPLLGPCSEYCQERRRRDHASPRTVACLRL